MVTIELEFEKSTKNKVRFHHPDFGSIYIPNEKFAELGMPERIRLSIEALAVELARPFKVA